MFLKITEFLVGHFPFISEFLIVSVKDNLVSLIGDELEIIFNYDISENKINIELDLSPYLINNNSNLECYRRSLLTIDKLACHLGIRPINFIGITKLNMDKMIEIHCSQLVNVWTSLRKLENYKYELSKYLIYENSQNVKLKEVQFFDAKSIKSNEIVSPVKYQREIKLLCSHRNKLSEYDLKIFYSSMSIVNI